MRAVAALCLLALIAPLFGLFAIAAPSSSGGVIVDITDAANQPVESARVLLEGSSTFAAISGKTGSAQFKGVPVGEYAVHVLLKGVDVGPVVSLRVVAGTDMTVGITISNGETPKVIAQVRSEQEQIPSVTIIDDDSMERKLANSLFGALGEFSGINLISSGATTDASQGISLDGHNPTQVQVSLDGFPLNAPGIAANMRAIDPDLYTSAVVNSLAQQNAPGGTLNLRSANPTPKWQADLTLGLASTGYNYGGDVTGTNKKLGVTVTLAHRSTSSLIDGLLYTDASGLYYTHEGDSTTSGQLVKLQYPLGSSQKLEGEFTNSATSTQISCLLISGGVPCGYGPGNTNTTSLQQGSFRDIASIGALALAGSYSVSASNDINDMLAEYIAGVPAPFGYTSNGVTRSYSLIAQMPVASLHKLAVSFTGGSYTGTTSGFTAPSTPYFSSPQSSTYSAIQVSDSVQATKQLRVNGSFSSNASSGTPPSASASAGILWNPTKADSYTANYQVSGSTPQVATILLLTDPTELQFDCSANLGYGSAPGDPLRANTSTDTTVSYTHHWSTVQVAVQGYQQVQNGVLLPVQVNGAALASLGELSAAYIETAQNTFYSPGACGAAPSIPFGAQNLYFTTNVGGVEYVYEGGAIKGTVKLHNLTMTSAYNVSVAKALSNDVRLDNPLSTLIPDSQLPNVPIHAGNLAMDYKAPHASLEYLANLHYIAINNANNLPAYTTLDVGVTTHLARGILTLGATNLTNTYAGIFASPNNAVPLQTLGGVPVSTLATPLGPRAFSLTYKTQLFKPF